MENAKVRAYGGLLKITQRQYTILQFFAFAVLVILFAMSFIYDLDQHFFGNARAVFLVVIALEVVETVYMFRKFKKVKEKQNV